ncbi:MAG: hypothetical protein EHM78_02050 [Myxococcaceae bacterium]|nr:MAG: hypothetical protein EHM78_02050 [Myxococcaceae bacterium]
MDKLAQAIDLEPEVRQELPPADAPEAVRAGMVLPDYVTHMDGATRSGMLSAAAVVREYEATAKMIDEMGQELRASQDRVAEMMSTYAEAFKKLQDTVQAYRDEGKRLFEQVESSSKLADRVSETCDMLRRELEEAGRRDDNS